MRKILLVLVAFMLIFALAGCNNGSTSSRGISLPTKPGDKPTYPLVAVIELAAVTDKVELVTAEGDKVTVKGWIAEAEDDGLNPSLFLTKASATREDALKVVAIDIPDDDMQAFTLEAEAKNGTSLMIDGAKNVILVIEQIRIVGKDGKDKVNLANLMKKFAGDLNALAKEYGIEASDLTPTIVGTILDAKIAEFITIPGTWKSETNVINLNDYE